MHFLLCNCYGCNNELLTVKEVKGRMCEGHRRQAASDDYYVGVCWDCGYPTAVGNRVWNRKDGGYIIKAKYIMTKGCLSCTGEPQNNINWMTIPGESKERIISDIRVMEITDQNNLLFEDYQPISTD
jgi:hypothetical protein